jgi:hypothetical protein
MIRAFCGFLFAGSVISSVSALSRSIKAAPWLKWRTRAGVNSGVHLNLSSEELLSVHDRDKNRKLIASIRWRDRSSSSDAQKGDYHRN